MGSRTPAPSFRLTNDSTRHYWNFRLSAIAQIAIALIVIAQIVIVLMVGGLMVINGRIDLGTVIAFSGYVGLLAKPVSSISNLISTALNGVAGGRRVFNIIDEEPTVKDAPDATDYEFKGGRIQCADVDFSYVPGRKILRHNTFEVQPGEAIGICGPTGAGKSTLLDALCLALYLRTLGPTVGQADTFEFQVIAPTWGVAHPTGYPLYILCGKLFSLLPLGSVAWMSAVVRKQTLPANCSPSSRMP